MRDDESWMVSEEALQVMMRPTLPSSLGAVYYLVAVWVGSWPLYPGMHSSWLFWELELVTERVRGRDQ